MLGGSTLFKLLADKSITACLLLSNIIPPFILGFIEILLPSCINPLSAFNWPELVNLENVISVDPIEMVSSLLLHTKLEPPLISPSSTNTNAPLISLEATCKLKSSVLVHVPVAHKYIPFCEAIC